MRLLLSPLDASSLWLLRSGRAWIGLAVIGSPRVCLWLSGCRPVGIVTCRLMSSLCFVDSYNVYSYPEYSLSTLPPESLQTSPPTPANMLRAPLARCHSLLPDSP